MNPETEQNQSADRRSASWDLKNAAGNYLSLVLTQFGSAFFAFAGVWLISKQIGSEGYGGVVAIIAASQVAQILVNWTCYAVVRFGTEEFVETEKIARVFWLRLLVLVPNALIVIAASSLWFPPLAGWLKLSPAAFWFVIAHFAVSAFWIHVQFSLQGAKLPRVQGYLLMFERLLTFVGIAALILTARLGPLEALICYTAAPLIVSLAGVFLLRRYVFARFTVDVRFFREIVAYSLPLLPFSLVGYFSGSYVDAIFISQFLSTKELGIYAVATQINGIAMQFPTVANALLLPLFITLQKEDEGGKKDSYFRNIVPALTLLGGIGYSFGALVAFFAVPFVFGDDFRQSTMPLWILLSAAVVSLPVLFGYSALSNSTSTTHISMFAAILSAVANVIANFVLIPRYGMVGCAWATVIAYFVSVLTFALMLRHRLEIPLSWVFWSILPSIAGAVSLTLTANSALSLGVCLMISFLIGYWYRASVGAAFAILGNLRRR